MKNICAYVHTGVGEKQEMKSSRETVRTQEEERGRGEGKGRNDVCDQKMLFAMCQQATMKPVIL